MKRREAAAARKKNVEEYTIFVTGLHPKIDESDLFDFFSHVGRVEDIRLIRDLKNNKSKGYATPTPPPPPPPAPHTVAPLFVH